ncbi:protein MIS12 homolog isoform X2 [Periplaneta americana]|uniref:protein MIS12 homolog isoform X2 n=1 Tax=Periplaneta americana TaxID=6978 RepID=UPI0037E72F48
MDRNHDNCLKEAYELQLYNFSTQTVLDLQSIVIDNIQCKTKELEDKLIQNLQTQHSAIKSAISALETESITCAEERLKQLPSVIDEYFAIPCNVLLPEDAPQRKQYSEQDEWLLDCEINNLETRAKRAYLMEAYLRKEIEVQEKLKTLKSEHEEFEQLYLENEIDQVSHKLQCETEEIVKTVKATKNANFLSGTSTKKI